ncbi:hypothetical protein BDM02DRAFT_3121029 [Thelephora ganbajun]|uniref:Uncharacterized protein n=1 Tax=Thelephora ganbajun TaxID=370292 RepID=A0ACB6Z5K5_THEGA|nr:hypothetical protein BDM02DRAFT_3121029 [Thelephora ganbajun]
MSIADHVDSVLSEQQRARHPHWLDGPNRIYHSSPDVAPTLSRSKCTLEHQNHDSSSYAKTIEFSPNRDPQNTKLDATVVESFTDTEAAGVVVTGGGFNLGVEGTVACSVNSLAVPFNYSLPPVARFLRPSTRFDS